MLWFINSLICSVTLFFNKIDILTRVYDILLKSCNLSNPKLFSTQTKCLWKKEKEKEEEKRKSYNLSSANIIFGPQNWPFLSISVRFAIGATIRTGQDSVSPVCGIFFCYAGQRELKLGVKKIILIYCPHNFKICFIMVGGGGIDAFPHTHREIHYSVVSLTF